MDVHGDLNLRGNALSNFYIKPDTEFPANPQPGQMVFRRKKLYICAEIKVGLPVWLPLTQELEAYIHQQNAPLQAWTISHNLNCATPFVQVYDETGRMVVPDYIDGSTKNQVVISFSTAQAGTAIIQMGSTSGAPKENYVFSAEYVDLNTWVVNHGLGYYPDVTVYVGNEQVSPDSITHNSTMQATISFSVPTTGYVRCI